MPGFKSLRRSVLHTIWEIEKGFPSLAANDLFTHRLVPIDLNATARGDAPETHRHWPARQTCHASRTGTTAATTRPGRPRNWLRPLAHPVAVTGVGR